MTTASWIVEIIEPDGTRWFVGPFKSEDDVMAWIDKYPDTEETLTPLYMNPVREPENGNRPRRRSSGSGSGASGRLHIENLPDGAA